MIYTEYQQVLLTQLQNNDKRIEEIKKEQEEIQNMFLQESKFKPGDLVQVDYKISNATFKVRGCGESRGEGGTAWQNTTTMRAERERAGPMRSIMNSWKSCAEIGRSSGSLWTRVQPALLRASGGTGDIGWSRQRTGCWRASS